MMAMLMMTTDPRKDLSASDVDDGDDDDEEEEEEGQEKDDNDGYAEPKEGLVSTGAVVVLRVAMGNLRYHVSDRQQNLMMVNFFLAIWT